MKSPPPTSSSSAPWKPSSPASSIPGTPDNAPPSTFSTRSPPAPSADRSPAAFAKLRDAYLKVFPDLPADHKKRLAAATSPDQLAELFYWILDHGKRVRLRVKTVFRGEIGDDDDDKTPAKTVEVWTAFGDCGITFQTGETYLVYADDDEESNIMTTGACTRTRRLTDAGDDLAYLYFFKNYADSAGRVEGFVTGDLLFLRDLDLAHYTGRIGAPVAAVVELKSGDRARYTETDDKGRFVFDGVAAGDFTVSAYAPGYPAANPPARRSQARPHGKTRLRHTSTGRAARADPHP